MNPQEPPRAPRAFHLAQVNIARMRSALEDPIMEGFRSQLERINALADQSPGFVWRLQTEAGDATSLAVYEDPRILFNMSVWESLEALHAYVYRSDHVNLLRGRRGWFLPLSKPALALWWVPAGSLPSMGDGRDRLALLEGHGPTRAAFTFRHPFPAPSGASRAPPEIDAEFCTDPAQDQTIKHESPNSWAR